MFILSLKNSLQTRKLSQIPSGQLFPPSFEIKSCKSGDAIFKLSLSYHLYNARFSSDGGKRTLGCQLWVLRLSLSWTVIF